MTICEGWSINLNLFRILNQIQDSDQICNAYLKLWFISFELMPIETSLWHHNHQHATSRYASKGTIVMKHVSCVISSELKIFARYEKHMSYFSSVYLHLITNDLYTISLASKLLKWDEFSSFSIWDEFQFVSCVISSELKIFARYEKHMSYFSSVYLHLITNDLYTISLASKLLKWDEFSSFSIWDEFQFHRQKRPMAFWDATTYPL